MGRFVNRQMESYKIIHNLMSASLPMTSVSDSCFTTLTSCTDHEHTYSTWRMCMYTEWARVYSPTPPSRHHYCTMAAGRGFGCTMLHNSDDTCGGYGNGTNTDTYPTQGIGQAHTDTYHTLTHIRMHLHLHKNLYVQCIQQHSHTGTNMSSSIPCAYVRMYVHSMAPPDTAGCIIHTVYRSGSSWCGDTLRYTWQIIHLEQTSVIHILIDNEE